MAAHTLSLLAFSRQAVAGLVALALFASDAAGLVAADAGKVSVVIPMVRIEVATPNPAVQQTYELEIDSFDGQSLKGFEPEPAAGGVRSLITIDMASVRSLAFFQRTIERPAPEPAHPDPGREPDPREPSKELLRRLDNVVRDLSDQQTAKILELLKSPQEFAQLQAHLARRMEAAETPAELKAAVHADLLAEYLFACVNAARNFEHTTSTQYFAQVPNFVREAQADTAATVKTISAAENRKEAGNLLNAQDVTRDFLMLARPLAARAWNQTVPPERAVEMGATKRFGNGPKPNKLRPRPND